MLPKFVCRIGRGGFKDRPMAGSLDHQRYAGLRGLPGCQGVLPNGGVQTPAAQRR